MNDSFYKQLIEESQTGYAYYKIICDEYGIACDYEFIEVNSIFEELTGLKNSNIVGRRVTEILPRIRTSEFDWIHFYGDIAINGVKKEFEHFSQMLNKWYRVKAYSPEKNRFVTHFIDISDQKQAEEMRQSKTAFFNALTNASFDGILVVNENQKRILTNRRMFEMFNVPQYIIDDEDDTLMFKHVISLTKDPEKFLERVRGLYNDINNTSHDVIEFKNGMVLDRYSAPILDKKGKYYGRIWTFHDITERRNLQKALSNEKKLLEITLLSVVDGVISTDNKGNIMFLNRVTELLTGWTQESARGKSIEEVFNIVNEFTREKDENIVRKVLESGKVLEFANHTILISKDGIERAIENSAAPIVKENGEIVGVVLVFKDVTDKRERQKEILYLSYHDQLTGLYNRRFYEEEIKRLNIGKNIPLTIVMGDVNGLKLINDSFGHVMGDELLKKVSEVIRAGCRAGDVIARLGGDEFVAILPKTDALEAEQIIKRITDLTLSEKVGLIDISISFGYETKNNAEEKIEEILKKVEDNMYKKKLFERSMRGKTIKAIISTLHEKNKREEQHSHRVSELCKSMGEALGLAEKDIQELKTVGLLHDIGKIAIDENILNKPGKLANDEWEKIKRHPEIGFRILNTVDDMSDMANYVLNHHERWDGKGYPKGLKGDEIPFISRIITIVDAYDAMTSDRSYRSALSDEIAIGELKKNAGSQFDTELVNVFIEKVVKSD
ncbi:MAG TPA: HD domain-containing phosphohydrolase [Clostridium sp.]|uniref:HD domain-containing phosphohydrolase n=1 Tax=Clostridium sp. TaxID=1506 RepID=UPI002F93DFAC